MEKTGEANTAWLIINAGATAPTEVVIGGTSTPGIKMRANLDGNETVFNETSYDIDFRIEGATNTSLFYLNAGLDAIGIGKAATSDYLLDVNGDVNIPATYNYKIAGVNLPQGDGWSDAGVTWSYASASTFTITGDYTAVYTKGTKINWTQTTVKYGVVLSSSYSAPNTTVTIAVNTDYTIANAAISLNHYSRAATPAGFPSSFAFSPTWTNVTVGNGTQSAEYSVIGNTVKYKVSLIWAAAAATSAISGAVQITVPISVLSDYVAYDPLGAATIVDNGVSVYQGSCFYGGSNIVEMRCLNAAGTYVVSQATSGTVPFTFGVNDRFMMEFSYIF
jgi:hypothetical protein